MFRTGGEEATLLEERGGLANRVRLKGGRLIWEWQVDLVVVICGGWKLLVFIQERC